ncbi:MAG: IS21 family transposase [Candidatus Omnitrophica bacterium]|nr:IS21 family transposase [Candidatus Omnitrophota bacterium]MBU0897474.1 IS21 family transposase [Candidatus Omnitrophota bacterium]MBU1134881.1 IS21 family transposase [Candidatus Omnitrophota bacterium]MBU1367815.1 IS21 family transposase [Candidatus Omnitrophota bacterium]MBU1524716.1 IS21 family transposase [Candidatus Omnitrophota bacterium]
MLSKTEKTKAIAAAKAGMDDKTARKYLRIGKLPSEVKKAHAWRTRQDPFAQVWEEAKTMLAINPGLEALTIFEYLQREYPMRFSDGQLRTLQRRTKAWRATEGPAKEVFFPQEHRPGELSEADFTHMKELWITIGGELFDHLLYHFVLTYSNWETGTICFSESFESLSSGYQNAVWELGGASKKNRTDRMSAAVNKDCNPEKFTKSYHSLLRHYGVEPERTNPARANENGDVEQRHYRLKKSIKQALMIRGSRDFSNRNEYEQFLRKIFDQLNLGRWQRLQEELALLRQLPARRLNDYKMIEVSVGPSSTIHAQKNTYSVHSRLIGEKVQVKVYVDSLEIRYAQKVIDRLPRLRSEGKCCIQYQHIIDWLVRKPGAFENYRYKSEMFPSSYFRMAYDYLKQHNSLRANKEYVRILYLAAKEGESVTESAIRVLLSQEAAISAKAVEEVVLQNNQLPSPTEVIIKNVALSQYDELLTIGKEKEVAIHG